MITTKSCSTCEHFPNDHHCVGCVWDQGKGENTKWELKINPIVIERAVLDKIRAELHANAEMHIDGVYYLCEDWIDEIIGKHISCGEQGKGANE